MWRRIRKWGLFFGLAGLIGGWGRVYLDKVVYNPDEIYYVEKGVMIDDWLKGGDLSRWNKDEFLKSPNDRSLFNILVYGGWEKIWSGGRYSQKYVGRIGATRRNWYWQSLAAGKFTPKPLKQMKEMGSETVNLIMRGRWLAGMLGLISLGLMFWWWGWWGVMGWELLMASVVFLPTIVMMTSDAFVFLFSVGLSWQWGRVMSQSDWENDNWGWLKMIGWGGALVASKINGLLVVGLMALLVMEVSWWERKVKKGWFRSLSLIGGSGLILWLANPQWGMSALSGIRDLFLTRGLTVAGQANAWLERGQVMVGMNPIQVIKYLGDSYSWQGINFKWLSAISLGLAILGLKEWWRSKQKEIWWWGVMALILLMSQFEQTILVKGLPWVRYYMFGMMGLVFFEVMGLKKMSRWLRRRRQ